MKQKFSCPEELHMFFLEELKTIVGVNAKVDTRYGVFQYGIYPVGYDKCLWQITIRSLFAFFDKFGFRYYIDFEEGYLRAYTYESEQKNRGRL